MKVDFFRRTSFFLAQTCILLVFLFLFVSRGLAEGVSVPDAEEAQREQAQLTGAEEELSGFESPEMIHQAGIENSMVVMKLLFFGGALGLGSLHASSGLEILRYFYMLHHYANAFANNPYFPIYISPIGVGVLSFLFVGGLVTWPFYSLSKNKAALRRWEEFQRNVSASIDRATDLSELPSIHSEILSSRDYEWAIERHEDWAQAYLNVALLRKQAELKALINGNCVVALRITGTAY